MDPTGPNRHSVTPSDQSLIALVRNGNENAASELYGRYARRLFGLVEAKMGERLRAQTTAEDIVQSVFKSVFRGVKSGSYDAPPGESLWSLMAIVAVHKLSSTAQRHSAKCRDERRNISLANLEETLASDSFPGELLEMSFREALNMMRPIDQEIFNLRLMQHTVEEISELTQRSRRTVERSLQNSRLRLIAMLTDEEPS